ncbi:MAG: PKD domain-containing protein [Bacteroidota bacterium]
MKKLILVILIFNIQYTIIPGIIGISLLLNNNQLIAQTWSPLQKQIKHYPGGGLTVKDLHVYNNMLYVSGGFIEAGAITANHVASWDGTNWGNLGYGIDYSTYVECIASYNNELYVGGSFFDAGAPGSDIDKIARWNGNSWNSIDNAFISTPPTYWVRSMEVYNGELYIGGYFNLIGNTYGIARWNGSQWDSVGTGVGGKVYAMAIYNNELYVGGIFGYAGDTTAYDIARWDGSQWKSVGIGVDGDVNVFEVDTLNNILYVGGDFFNSYNLDSTIISSKFVSQWNGQQWSLLPVVPLQTNCTSLTIYHGKLYAAGLALTGSLSDINFAIWDGKSWEAITGLNNGINAMAVYQDTLYAGGYFTYAGNDSAFYIAKWATPNYCDSIHASIATISDTIFLSDSGLIQLNNTGYANRWWWSFGDEKTDTAENPNHFYDSAGTYTITLVATYGLCPKDTDSATITVIDNCSQFNASIYTPSDTVTMSAGTAQVMFYDSSDYAEEWYWDFGDGASASSVQHPVHTYDSAATFTVMLVVSYGSCKDTAYANITVKDEVGVDELRPPVGGDELRIYPNPSGGGFFVECQMSNVKYQMSNVKIYDMRGELKEELSFIKTKQLQINTNGWAKGIYVCMLEVDGKNVANERIVVD